MKRPTPAPVKPVKPAARPNVAVRHVTPVRAGSGATRPASDALPAGVGGVQVTSIRPNTANRSDGAGGAVANKPATKAAKAVPGQGVGRAIAAGGSNTAPAVAPVKVGTVSSAPGGQLDKNPRYSLKNPKWKTQWCFAFQKGRCQRHPDNCLYAHGRDDFRSVRIAALNYAARHGRAAAGRTASDARNGSAPATAPPASRSRAR